MLNEMFEMQKTLNDSTNGHQWVDGLTKTNKKINWMRCFRLELAEAIDQSFNWKHWKNTEGVEQFSFIETKDFDGLHNLKIEIVDAWHFIMSEIIAKGWTEEFNRDIIFNFHVKRRSGESLIKLIESVNYLAFNYEDSSFESIDPTMENDLFKMTCILEKFVKLTLSVMTLKELYEIYILKNALNLFRQQNGYKDGTYIKEWGKEKVEDNVILDQYIQSGKEISLTLTMEFLEFEYKRLNS